MACGAVPPAPCSCSLHEELKGQDFLVAPDTLGLAYMDREAQLVKS
jgi:hypothetical protein